MDTAALHMEQSQLNQNALNASFGGTAQQVTKLRQAQTEELFKGLTRSSFYPELESEVPETRRQPGAGPGEASETPHAGYASEGSDGPRQGTEQLYAIFQLSKVHQLNLLYQQINVSHLATRLKQSH